jgi:hypothetical protein
MIGDTIAAAPEHRHRREHLGRRREFAREHESEQHDEDDPPDRSLDAPDHEVDGERHEEHEEQVQLGALMLVDVGREAEDEAAHHRCPEPMGESDAQ